MTDKEIAREITLDEILSYFKERVKDFFATYKNESGGEDRIEICLIREGYRTLLRAEEKLKRQQAEIEQLRQLFVESGKEQDRLMAEIERLKGDFADFGKTVFLTREEAEKALKGDVVNDERIQEEIV